MRDPSSTNFKMNKTYQRLIFLIISTLTLASAFCPREKVSKIGYCAYRITCTGYVRGVRIPDECKPSANHSVTVDVLLQNAIERFDDDIDKEFLKTVTTFQATAIWNTTYLSFLTYMTNLRKLVLSGNQIQAIDGTPFFNLKYLQYLDLSRNSLSDIGELFQFEEHPNRLKILFLNYNAIEEISGDVFEELTNLKELDLSYNLISNLDEEPFNNMTSLEILRLNNNRIKDLNGAVNSLQNLKHLYIRGNQIQNIDEPSLDIIKQLQTFDISGNQLENLTPMMFFRKWKHFNGICRIILSENHLTSIPNAAPNNFLSRSTKSVEHNVDVSTEVDLSKNNIYNIEYNAFNSTVKMTSLDLSKNNLYNFILDPNDIKYVTFLNLSSNCITQLYFQSFSSMTNLQNLDLSHNKLNFVPEGTFNNNYNLKHVNMSYNEIKMLKRLQFKMFNAEGGVLDLSNNGLSRLMSSFAESLRLTVLILNSNNIVDAGFIDLLYQHELRMLEMKRNFICKLNHTSLRLPLTLTYLDISENLIEDIGPSTFNRVHHLKSLKLRYNKLGKIEYGAFQGLTALSELDLSFNQIRYLDSKVLMDLKSLTVLSLRFNGLMNLDDKGWFGHKINLRVYLDGNSITCEWLGETLKNFHNGYTKMVPTATQLRIPSPKNSLEGIPCSAFNDHGIQKSSKIVDWTSNSVLADERLLATNQRILEAVKEQTNFLRYFMNQFNFIKISKSKY